MPKRPFTFAVRGLHYGRYGRDGEDERLSPLYVGYPGLVRGYEMGSFDPRDCVIVGAAQCASFDQLVGTRMAVLNGEVRFPLLGLFGGRSFYGAFPVELAVFGDAGVAWTSNDARPRFLGGDRDWVRSVGGAVRVNAFGYAILEIDYVRPLDRSDRGWHWQFNLTPGF
jgi:outer membrane protein assembly factor BamA